MGYTNVKVFEDGMPAWLKIPGNYACVTGDWVKKKLDKKAPITLIDSRPKRAKYDKGHIPTAISLPDSKFNKLSNKLPQDKKALIVFYCGGYKCKLSHKSAKKALKLGYTNVKVFSAGYPKWKKVSGAKAGKHSAKAADVKAGKEEGSIAIASFKKILKKNPQSIMLIDVRDADEYATGHFKTAVNIPTDDLEKKIATLPSDKPVVFVCSTGARSGEAFYMVQDSRPKMKNVFYVEAEITFKKDGSYKIKPNE
ncbi:rhodanese-like domain-containing protein [Desulfococcaceae bacterium HSG7]|nr:rhodanese-like domain-containing protein [Desulfococcaceae bacterium HSG7]